MSIDFSGWLKRTAINAGYFTAIGAAITMLYEFGPWVRTDTYAQHQDRFRMVAEETLPLAISEKLSQIITLERLIKESADAGLQERVREYRIKVDQLNREIERIRSLRKSVRGE